MHPNEVLDRNNKNWEKIYIEKEVIESKENNILGRNSFSRTKYTTKGIDGEKGGNGGQGGCAGNGGKVGTIELINANEVTEKHTGIQVSNHTSQKGEPGESGTPGKGGKGGKDKTAIYQKSYKRRTGTIGRWKDEKTYDRKNGSDGKKEELHNSKGIAEPENVEMIWYKPFVEYKKFMLKNLDNKFLKHNTEEFFQQLHKIQGDYSN
ncbi:MAG: hypothetical protein F6K25_16560 [Okeania sp. SIO2G4]|uniref:hypothetical protein n=1 Tax=unclassified Okeania TaxID=2634635 RepID=UPI0013B7FB72|nr:MULTISPECIES: hypothetical protein [unclassified Okeania]NEP07595.1 hypothetical protein [Okeania sp. SIO4D6]NEP38961.1 hypothetical protein [Okeania sp. SIO2H7]NEP73661.1 hypothetical protein [Okeania sp. SIO2G5]NEP94389.1 hypothetical protein [Okeania sp. SIO2F5]NEQ92221.1 hypothetical protein [Okeania sp. SIO2G4]